MKNFEKDLTGIIKNSIDKTININIPIDGIKQGNNLQIINILMEIQKRQALQSSLISKLSDEISSARRAIEAVAHHHKYYC